MTAATERIRQRFRKAYALQPKIGSFALLLQSSPVSDRIKFDVPHLGRKQSQSSKVTSKGTREEHVVSFTYGQLGTYIVFVFLIS